MEGTYIAEDVNDEALGRRLQDDEFIGESERQVSCSAGMCGEPHIKKLAGGYFDYHGTSFLRRRADVAETSQPTKPAGLFASYR